jgi:L-arabinose isomerase
MSEVCGQVVWLRAPHDGDDGVRLQLAESNADKTRTTDPKVYVLRKSHSAFGENYGLLLALALQGHRLTLVTQATEGRTEVDVLSVGIGTKTDG